MSVGSAIAATHYVWLAELCAAAMIAAATIAPAAPAQIQAQHCTLICAPAFTFTPAVIRSHVLGRARVRSLSTDAVTETPSTNNLELILGVSAPTLIPRTSLIASFQWLPTASRSGNPFTEYTASELDAKVRANTPSLTLGLSVNVLQSTATHGWLGLSAYAADLFSSAARPHDASAFTHKLDLGLSASLGLFNWMPKHVWLSKVTGTAILDYVATGLPHVGDEVPQGERVFVTGARPAVLIVGLSIPIAPIDP